MSDNDLNRDSTPLLKWYGYYIAGLAVFAASCAFDHANFAFLTYLVVGFSLNRLILRKLSLNPLHNTIGNASRAKLSAFLLWPLSYALLLFHMTVDKVL